MDTPFTYHEAEFDPNVLIPDGDLGWARYYFWLGLNVTRIGREVNEYNSKCRNLLKNPDHRWKHLFFLRQKEAEWSSLDWSLSAGVGTVTGFEGLRALDLDGCTNLRFVEMLLELLGLPSDYEWVIKTGSENGFSILLQVDKLDGVGENHSVSSYPPRVEFQSVIRKLEILWSTHLVLPPSVHSSGQRYGFINCGYPENLPIRIPTNRLAEMTAQVFQPDAVVHGSTYPGEM